MARDIIGEPAEVLVNFDAHHDLGYCDWNQLVGLAEQGQCTCDTWLCSLMQWYPDLASRIVFPDWMRGEYPIKEQVGSIRKVLPREMLSRVKMDFFTKKNGAISPVVIEPGETLDVEGVFVCRSGAWVPPWLDKSFVQFVKEGERVIGHPPMTPFDDDDTPALEPRTDFDYGEAVRLGEQWSLMQNNLMQKVLSDRRDDDDDNGDK